MIPPSPPLITHDNELKVKDKKKQKLDIRRVRVHPEQMLWTTSKAVALQSADVSISECALQLASLSFFFLNVVKLVKTPL